MQRMNLLGPTQERACRIAATVVEVDHLAQRGRLAVAKIRGGFGNVAYLALWLMALLSPLT
jgi:hypothetical protein